MTRYYFDTNALWKYYRGKEERGYLQLRRLVSQHKQPIVVSSLTVLEFISVLMKERRNGTLKRRDVRKAANKLSREIGATHTTRPFSIAVIPQGSFQQAEQLLLQYADRFSFNSHDSLHLAIAVKLQTTIPKITLVTSDRGLQNVCQQISLAFYDPENATDER